MDDDGTINEQGGQVRGHGPVRGRKADGGGSGGTGVSGKGGGLRPQRGPPATAAIPTVEPMSLRSVVCQDEAPGQAGHSRRWRRARPSLCPSASTRLIYNWMENVQRLVYFPAALVGPSDSRPGTATTAGRCTVSREDAHRVCPNAAASISTRMRTCWIPGSPRLCGPSRPWAGRRRPRTCEYFYPTDVLVTGYDIIFFWVARMIFSGCEQIGKTPFQHGADPRPGPGRQGPEDEQIPGQRH